MKKILLALAFLGIFSFAVAAQTTRPRVAATPTPPTIKNDTETRDPRSGPPVLQDAQHPDQTTSGGTPEKGDGSDEVLKVQTNLVTMPVSVLDRDGRFVSGLGQQDFKIFENGIEQKLEYFQSVEQPFTVVLLLDVSPSTQWKIDQIQDAAIAFIDQLRQNDRVIVISFDEHVHVMSRPTNNRAELRNAIRQTEIGDGTSLYEAVHQVIQQQLSRIEGRKAVVLFTDGVDTTSRRANFQSTTQEVEEADSLFYTIRYDTSSDMNGGMQFPPPMRRRGGWGNIAGIILGGGTFPSGGGGAGGSRQEYDTGRRYLETLAQNSGGREFEATSLQNLDTAFSGIAEELRRQYSIGYYPDKPGQPGERRQIRVRVMKPNLVVRAKNSYIFGQSDNDFAGR
ncbi:MAG TPA: VWA domain-containing protein [Pyrinomonadaceae bacterium]|nr:VWA domain-containing protein [Pyrinomonadaceae bacterium]